MPKKSILNFEERNKITEYQKNGFSYRKIAVLLNRSYSVVYNFIKLGDKYAKNNKGRTPKLSPLTKRRILYLAEQGNTSATEIKNELQLNVSTRRIRQICHAKQNGHKQEYPLVEEKLKSESESFSRDINYFKDTQLSSDTMNESCLEIKQSPPISPNELLYEVQSADGDDDDGEIESMSAKIASNVQDEYDVFGAFIATELRGLGHNMSLIRSVKRKIQLTILDAYETQSTTTIDLPSSSTVPQNSESGRIQIKREYYDPDDDTEFNNMPNSSS